MIKQLRNLFFAVVVFAVIANGDDEPTDSAVKYGQQIDQLTKLISVDSENVRLYSQRGDAYFFDGQFGNAVDDYDTMVELDAEQDTSHWRRGIAYYYNGQHKQAAAQFGRYHSYDNVDRENGIWRYLSQYQARGKKAAQQELLKYEKDDREPFGDVYKLFSGEISSREILDRIHATDMTSDENEKRLFYAHLYIGLNDAVEGRTTTAKKHLAMAAKNTWAPSAGYGPHYMWQVARLHVTQLEKTSQDQAADPTSR